MTATELLTADTASATARRRARLAAELDPAGVDALLVGDDIDIRYLTGFLGDDSVLVSARDRTWIVTDSRYDEYLNPWRGRTGLEVRMGIRHRLEDTVKAICAEEGIASLGIQAESTTVSGRARLGDALGGLRLVDLDGLLPRLRRRKDDDEIAAIERAVGIQQDALDSAIAQIELGMREHEFSAILEYELRRRGSTASFGPIIATGGNGSVIHYSTSDTPIERGGLLVDWGATSGFYCSDMTRTFAVGGMPSEIEAVYPIVLEAQLAAIDACRPGAICADVDAVARGVITKAGYGPNFGHGLGHGLGLEVHEGPYFNDLETDTTLEPGMVMTVEPGIYLPGIGGVRIEDDVVITDDGCRVLGAYPKTLDAMRVEPGERGGGVS